MKQFTARVLASFLIFSLSSTVLAQESLTTAEVSETSQRGVYPITGVDIDTPTQAQIAKYYHDSAKDNYAHNPSFTSGASLMEPFSPGELSAVTQAAALDVLNYVRYVAGISYDLTIEPSYIPSTQAGTLMNALNKALSHFPTQPEGVSDELYKLGYAGTSQSNLSSGRYTLGAAIVQGWMADSSSVSNLETVGHRRWILNPNMEKTAFGMVGSYSAMYTVDHFNSSASSATGVAWPAQNMPSNLFGTRYPWSFTSASTSAAEQVTVTLTRLNDNKVWIFTNEDDDYEGKYLNIDTSSNSGVMGQLGTSTIIFRPSPSEVTCNAGDVYYVEISGDVTAAYPVSFFDVDATSTTSGSLSPSSVSNSFIYSPDVENEVFVSWKGTETAELAQVTLSEREVKVGEKTTFDVLLEEGYSIEKIEVSAELGGEVPFYRDLSTDSYYFYQPEEAVTVYVTLRNSMEEPYVRSFEDVKADDWFHPQVTTISGLGVMSGEEDNFNPTIGATRGMIAQALLNFSQESATYSGISAHTFEDVGEEYESAVAWCYGRGVMIGYDSTMFGTTDSMSREAFATALRSFGKAMGLDTTVSKDLLEEYHDNTQISDWAYEGILWCVEQGVMSGFDGELYPQKSLTNGELASMLTAFYEKLM